MYVVVFEVLQREKSKEDVPGLMQLVCIIIGFSALMMVEILGKLSNDYDNDKIFIGKNCNVKIKLY